MVAIEWLDLPLSQLIAAKLLASITIELHRELASYRWQALPTMTSILRRIFRWEVCC